MTQDEAIAMASRAFDAAWWESTAHNPGHDSRHMSDSWQRFLDREGLWVLCHRCGSRTYGALHPCTDGRLMMASTNGED